MSSRERAEGGLEPDSAAAARLAARRIALSGGRFLDLEKAPLVMGIINCTPDSFYPGSRSATLESALAAARRMISEGADLLDVGGESTRPGAEPVDSGEELKRVVPVIEAIRRESQLPVSIDTRKAEVALAALDAGADIVNDVSALADDPGLAPLVAARRAVVVLMHRRGDAKSMQVDPHYEDTVGEIAAELMQAVEGATAAGIARDRIILDPGIGFGKRVCDNLLILKELGRLAALGFPILIGLSRKSFLGKILGGLGVEERLLGTVIANTYAVCGGAAIVRVHDVAEAAAMKRLLGAIAEARQEA